jgi:hypothetical protein
MGILVAPAQWRCRIRWPVRQFRMSTPRRGPEAPNVGRLLQRLADGLSDAQATVLRKLVEPVLKLWNALQVDDRFPFRRRLGTSDALLLCRQSNHPWVSAQFPVPRPVGFADTISLRPIPGAASPVDFRRTRKPPLPYRKKARLMFRVIFREYFNVYFNVRALGPKTPRLQATTSSRLTGRSTTGGPPIPAPTSSSTRYGSPSTARSH